MSDSLPSGGVRRRVPLSVRIRVGLSLGILLGLGSVGTMALWTTSGSIATGTITAAQLDVTVDGSLAGTANRDGSLTEVSWGMTDMLPGEQRAMTFTVANAGVSEIPLDVRLNAYATGTLAPALRFTFFDGGTATNSGGSLTAPLAGSYRSGGCTGGVQIGAANQAVAAATPSTVVDSSKQRLAVGQSMVYCVVVSVDNSTATHTNPALANATATAFFVVRATQDGAP